MVALDEGNPAEAAQDQKQVVAEPKGTFVAEPTAAGEFVRLVLMTDKRFHAEQAVVCIKAPCEPMVWQGTYQRVVQDGAQFLRFVDDTGAALVDAEYQYNEGVLEVRPSPAAPFQAMVRGQAWCGQVNDCKVQGLITPACEGAWHCHEAACAFQVNGSENTI